MKILHILDHSIPMHSGYTFRTRAILGEQKELGWDTVQLTSIKHTAEAAAEEEVEGLYFYRTHDTNAFLGRIPVLNQWEVARSLERRLDQVIPKERPDILHAHSPALNGVAAVHAGRKYGLPVVYECRAFWEDAALDHGTSTEGGMRYRLSRALETWVFRNADAVTTICEGLRRDIAARGIPESKITVIPNAVDIGRFSFCAPRNDELANRLGLKDTVILGFIGSFYRYEGLSLAVRALPAILESHPQVRLMLVGGGPQAENLKELVRELGLESRVLFVGRVPHEQVGEYYDLVDIFLYPRMHMRLTDLVTPLKPLEAMAKGKLVLASDVGGHKELITDGVNGRLFKADSIEALVAAVSGILEQRDDWQQFRERGRAFVEKERNWKGSVTRYRAIYESLNRAQHK